jgi:hypothetical protein
MAEARSRELVAVDLDGMAVAVDRRVGPDFHHGPVGSDTGHSQRRCHVDIGGKSRRRVIPHRLEGCGYVPVRNDAADSGLWVINRTRQVVYAKATLSIRDRLKAAKAPGGAGRYPEAAGLARRLSGRTRMQGEKKFDQLTGVADTP